MILQVEVNGRTRIVSVEPVAPGSGRFRVTIDGRTREVDARSVDAWTLSLIVLDAGGASHEVGLVDSGVPGELIVQTREGPWRAVVKGRKAPRDRSAAPSPPATDKVTEQAQAWSTRQSGKSCPSSMHAASSYLAVALPEVDLGRAQAMRAPRSVRMSPPVPMS